MVKRLALALALVLSATATFAQSLPNNALVVGRGSGVAGYKSVGPCTNATQVVLWSGGVPTCTNISTFMATVSATSPLQSILTGVDYRVSIIPQATTGVPIVSAGAGNPPTFGTTTVAGGGTGLTTLTAFNVLLGNGTSNLAFAAPGATGIPLVSQGAAANPAFGTAGVAGGGTGLTSGSAGQILYYSGTTTLANAGPFTGLLLFNGAGAPSVWTGATCVDAIYSLSASGTPNCMVVAAGSNITVTPSGTSPRTLTIASTASGSGCTNPGGVTNVYCGVTGVITTGTNNTAVGSGTGDSLTTGNDNTMYGFNAGTQITSAGGNILIGRNAGFGITTSGGVVPGNNNVYIGYETGYGHTTGGYNVAVGLYSGQWYSTTVETTAIGATAGLSITTGLHNTAVGANALGGDYVPAVSGTAITGAENVAVGYNSLIGTTTGGNNTCVGAQSCAAYAPSALAGSNNVALGWSALQDITGAAAGNIAIGTLALNDQTSSINNIAIGFAAGEGILTGTRNLLIGHNPTSTVCDTVLTNAVLIGSQVDCSTILSNTMTFALGDGTIRLSADASGNFRMHAYGAGLMQTGATGIISILTLGTGVTTWLGTPSSANLAAALTDETGTGAAVFANTPTLVTPILGAATGTTLALSSFINLTEIASPANPSADNLRLFAKDVAGNTNLFTRDSAGTEVNLSLGAGGAAAATQAEMEAASSTSVFASPGRVQYHPGAPKAWAYCTQSGGTYTLAASYNISGGTCNKTGTGELNPSFTVAMSSASYPCIANGTASQSLVSSSPNTSGNFTISIRNNTTGSAEDSSISVVCFGDQ